MNLIKTKIDGLIILRPNIIYDERGCFTETFNQSKIDELLGNINFVQENESFSLKGVLRGLHFQKPPFAQSKLVKCVKGCILDVALDLRKDSKSYRQFEITTLSDENKKQLFIPKGFAHGFIVLSESAILSYKVDNYYNHKAESGVIWNDPDLKIDWKIDKNQIIISEKDKSLPKLAEIINPF